MFWKTISPYFVSNPKKTSKITLVDEKSNTLSEDEKIADIFNKFFGNIIKNLNVSINSEVLEDVLMIQDPIIAAIEKYKRHPSILKIKKHIRVESYFDFKHIDDKKMAEVQKVLNAKKAKQENYIPIKLIKDIELFSFVLSKMFNFYIDKASFPNSLKQADITPVHKKNDTNDKNNYRPVSILPSLSKAFKKCLYDQIYAYTDSILSKAQCSINSSYSSFLDLLIGVPQGSILSPLVFNIYISLTFSCSLMTIM